ncbi:MAG: hypothetical protein LC723_13435 [Actinobacteria bacterium]|nr:hypothetical protein [Actinomycetota bacterium]
MTLTETDKAYLAGLFDGEGCVGYYNRGITKGVAYHSASVSICMTDLRPIQWVLDVVGYGAISFSEKPESRRKVCSWQLTNQKQIRELLAALRPYLKLKAEQVDVLLALYEVEDQLPKGPGSVTPEVVTRRQEVVAAMKSMKRAVYVVEGVETRRAGTSL